MFGQNILSTLLAADGPNGVVEILKNDAFAGNADAIGSITSVVDGGFSFFISVVAFFMISVALLRNVLAGAYCAFPKFWDQVDKAHSENEQKAFYESITGLKDSYKTMSMGSIKTFLFRIIPNIKCLTEFADETQDGKRYFIKAIPQMILVVCLGVFIYNGYWRDATGQVAAFGGEMFKRVLLDWDPVEAFDSLINTAGRPTFASDNSVTFFGKNKNKAAEAIYSAILGKYGDITTAQAKASLAGQIDTIVESMFPTGDEWLTNEDRYNVSVEAQMVINMPAVNNDDLSSTFKKQWVYTIGVDPAEGTGSSSGDFGPITFESQREPAINENWMIRVLISSEKNNNERDSSAAGGLKVTLTVGDGGTFSWGQSMTDKSFTLEDGTQVTLDMNGKEGTVKVTAPEGGSKTGAQKTSGSIPITLSNGGSTSMQVTAIEVSSGATFGISVSEGDYTVSEENGVWKATKKSSDESEEETE